MNDVTKLIMHLDERSYPIYIGQDLWQQQIIAQHVIGSQILIVSNQTVAPLYLDSLKASLSQWHCDQLILPDGEQYKNWVTLSQIFDLLVANRHLRSTTLIALGGGVIGDLTGFAAACYQRGVNFIQTPTTLLSQVDASIGGKTAVNHPLAKNMIGAFYQPKAVLIDIQTLATLPQREFCCGLAEVIKAALIYDADFFYWLEAHLQQVLAKEPSALSHMIMQACSIKMKVVMADEKEANIRAILNFGHTFGHAIEQAFQYENYLHGEAVAIGMVLASDLSVKMGWLDAKMLDRIKNLLTMANLPITLPQSVNPKQLIATMNTDKKNDLSGLRLVLLKGFGQATLSSQIDPDLLLMTIKQNQNSYSA